MLAGSISSEPLFLTLITQSQFYIKFEWTQPLDLGGIPLTQYRVYWDADNLGSTDLDLFTQAGIKLPSETIYTQSSNVQSGVTYQFFVIAQNQVGDSDRSQLLGVKAATAPLVVTQI
jgi:hypothetical protein